MIELLKFLGFMYLLLGGIVAMMGANNFKEVVLSFTVGPIGLFWFVFKDPTK